MNRFIQVLLAALCLALLVCTHASAIPGFTQGGRYRPPGDCVPPNTGNGQGGLQGGGSSGPGCGRSDGVAPTGSPGGTGAAIARPAGRGGPGRALVSGMGRKRTRASTGSDRWELWWEFNNDSFLQLKERLNRTVPVTGSSGFLVGRGRKDQAAPSRSVTIEAALNKILPALRSALGEKDERIRAAAIPAVARIVPADRADLIHDDLVALLGSREDELRRFACLSLGILGSSKASAICEDLMCDTRAGRSLVGGRKVGRLTRAFGALALGLIGDPSAASTLRKVIGKTDRGTEKDLAACAILALGLINDRSCRTQNAAFLVETLKDRKIDPFVKAFVPVALGKLGNRTVLPALTNGFRDEKENSWVRQSCAIGLGCLAEIEDEKEIAILTGAVTGEKNVPAKHFAMIALARICARDPFFACHEKLHRKTNALFLTELSQSGIAQNRAWAALAAALHSRNHMALHTETIAAIGNAFQEANDPSEKGACAVSLGLLEARCEAARLVEELSESKDEALRGYLCIGLGLMRWKDAAPMIRDLLDDDSLYSLRIQAAISLGLMGDPDMVDLLIKPLEQSGDLTIMSSAARALGLIGDQRAIDPLLRILGDPDAGSLARSCAATALGVLGEKTDLPWGAVLAENFNYCLRTDAFVQVFSLF